MKSKANLERCCELQGALIIDFSNAHAALIFQILATFVRGSAVKLSSQFFVIGLSGLSAAHVLVGERRLINVIEEVYEYLANFDVKSEILPTLYNCAERAFELPGYWSLVLLVVLAITL